MIIGATAGGVVAASQFLEKGYKVYLVDKDRSFKFSKEMEKELLPSLDNDKIPQEKQKYLWRHNKGLFRMVRGL